MDPLTESDMHVRPYHPDDAPGLLALFKDSIRRVASHDYDAAQVAAWASDDIDPTVWAARFEGRFVRVALDSTILAGFAELEPAGHVDRFYVSADHQRRGVGRMLMMALLVEARRVGLRRLYSEVSITARPFFERFGWTVLAGQTVVVRGVAFVNYRMELLLAG
jgi:putative acetyltransferase